MKFKVKQETFEGPLDLLLNLIEKEELEVTKISLARVADDFLSHVKEIDNVSAEILSEFLDISSKLILVKSKALLPQLELTEEEQEDIEELERQLKEYQSFKAVSIKLKEYVESSKRGFARNAKTAFEITLFDPPKSINQEKLFQILNDVLARIPEEEKKETDAIVEPPISIEDKVLEIEDIFRGGKNFSFAEFIKKSKTKVEAIVSFLTILELLKQKKIEVRQEKNFSDIIIIRREAKNNG